MHGHVPKDKIKRGEQHPRWTHGNRTLESQKQASEESAKLQMLEDALHLLGMTTAKRSRGRKSVEYYKITSVDEIKKAIT